MRLEVKIEKYLPKINECRVGTKVYPNMGKREMQKLTTMSSVSCVQIHEAQGDFCFIGQTFLGPWPTACPDPEKIWKNLYNTPPEIKMDLIRPSNVSPEFSGKLCEFSRRAYEKVVAQGPQRCIKNLGTPRDFSSYGVF